ncbi:hypothetical protein ACKWTF_001256 [Chironomus riparius]
MLAGKAFWIAFATPFFGALIVEAFFCIRNSYNPYVIPIPSYTISPTYPDYYDYGNYNSLGYNRLFGRRKNKKISKNQKNKNPKAQNAKTRIPKATNSKNKKQEIIEQQKSQRLTTMSAPLKFKPVAVKY